MMKRLKARKECILLPAVQAYGNVKALGQRDLPIEEGFSRTGKTMHDSPDAAAVSDHSHELFLSAELTINKIPEGLFRSHLKRKKVLTAGTGRLAQIIQPFPVERIVIHLIGRLPFKSPKIHLGKARHNNLPGIREEDSGRFPGSLQWTGINLVDIFPAPGFSSVIDSITT